MHLSTASPGGTTQGDTKGKERNIGELQTEFPPPRATGEITKFAFAFLEGERRGDF